jgi:hypothetical protein
MAARFMPKLYGEKVIKGTRMGNPLIDPAIQAHIDLKRAVEANGGKLTYVEYAPSFYERKSGSIYADASGFTEIIKIMIEFKDQVHPAVLNAAVLLSSSALPIRAIQPALVEWLKQRNDRNAEVRKPTISATVRGANDVDDLVAAEERLLRELLGSEKSEL